MLHIFYSSVVFVDGAIAYGGGIVMNQVREAIKKFTMAQEFLQNLAISSAHLKTKPGQLGAQAKAESINSNDLVGKKIFVSRFQ